MGLWKYWLSTLSPERLEQQRQYDRERNKMYNEAHKEQRKQKARERYEQLKEHLQAKHVCKTCGGHYTTQHEKQHYKTKKHIMCLKVSLGPGGVGGVGGDAPPAPPARTSSTSPFSISTPRSS